MIWLAPILLFAGVFPAIAQDSPAREEFWPEFNVFVKMNEHSRLFFIYSATKQDNRKTYADGMTGAHVDFYMLPMLGWRKRDLPDQSRQKLLMFRVGYLFTQSPASSPGGESVEHTPTIEANARVPLRWGLMLTDRSRGDLRFVNGVFTPRYRNRLKLERTFQLRRFDWTPYTHAEAFYDPRWNQFHQFRFAVGGELSITRRFVVEAYFLRQNDVKSSQRFVNATGVGLQFYLR